MIDKNDIEVLERLLNIAKTNGTDTIKIRAAKNQASERQVGEEGWLYYVVAYNVKGQYEKIMKELEKKA